MGSDRVMLMIGRLEILMREAERLASHNPSVGNMPQGGIRSMFVSDDDRSDDARFESLLSEASGIIYSIGDVFQAYGISVEDARVSEAFYDVRSARDAVSAMRRAIGALRAKAMLLP